MNLFDEIIINKANDLLDLLNDGRKEKDKYEPQYHCEYNGYVLFIAANKEKQPLCNIINDIGEIPKGFSVNWRTIQHIRQELKQ